jgi:hypothetical protein
VHAAEEELPTAARARLADPEGGSLSLHAHGSALAPILPAGSAAHAQGLVGSAATLFASVSHRLDEASNRFSNALLAKHVRALGDAPSTSDVNVTNVFKKVTQQLWSQASLITERMQQKLQPDAASQQAIWAKLQDWDGEDPAQFVATTAEQLVFLQQQRQQQHAQLRPWRPAGDWPEHKQAVRPPRSAPSSGVWQDPAQDIDLMERSTALLQHSAEKAKPFGAVAATLAAVLTSAGSATALVTGDAVMSSARRTRSGREVKPVLRLQDLTEEEKKTLMAKQAKLPSALAVAASMQQGAEHTTPVASTRSLKRQLDRSLVQNGHGKIEGGASARGVAGDHTATPVARLAGRADSDLLETIAAAGHGATASSAKAAST